MTAAVPPRKKTHPIDGYIAKNLKRLRVKRGMTQDDLAKLSGVIRGTINRYEMRHTSPYARILVSLCSALGCRLDDIVKPPKTFNDLF